MDGERDTLELTPAEGLTQAIPVKIPLWKNGTCWGLFVAALVILVWELDSWCGGTVLVRFKVIFDWLKITLDWFVGHPVVSFPVMYLFGHYYWPNRSRLVSARKHREETRIDSLDTPARTSILGRDDD
jgi:hypothetical protein